MGLQWLLDNALTVVVAVVSTLFVLTVVAVALGLGLGLGLKDECYCEPLDLPSLCPATEDRVIKVGVLHSLSGALATSERPVVDATLLAIQEINDAGGVNGYRLQPVLRDGNSNEAIFATEMTNLLATEQVAVVFGCWTSASRKAVLDPLAESDGLLFYPVQYEGVEQNPNVIYTGAAPNQQIIPVVRWAAGGERKWKKFALVGSDYIFPRTANAIIKDVIDYELSDSTYEEWYLVLGDINVGRIKEVAEDIVAYQPDVILNTINGDTNINFFLLLDQVGGGNIPIVSFSLAEPEIRSIGASILTGGLAAWNYFQSLPGTANSQFVDRFKARYGDASVIGDPMVAAYSGVYLYAEAARLAKTFDKQAILAALKSEQVRFNSPQGSLSVDPNNQHTVKSWYLGYADNNGQFVVYPEDDTPIIPDPYPLYPRHPDRESWEAFLHCWNGQWGGSWSNTQGPAFIKPNDQCDPESIDRRRRTGIDGGGLPHDHHHHQEL
ncbi:putative Extracellular ligandbinding receptor [Balamuthia mandrillaris]